MLCGLFVVKQPTVLDGLAFDPFSFQQDGLTAPEVDVGRGEIVDALVIAPVVVVRDERIDLSFEIAWQIIVLKSAFGEHRSYSIPLISSGVRSGVRPPA